MTEPAVAPRLLSNLGYRAGVVEGELRLCLALLHKLQPRLSRARFYGEDRLRGEIATRLGAGQTLLAHLEHQDAAAGERLRSVGGGRAERDLVMRIAEMPAERGKR